MSVSPLTHDVREMTHWLGTLQFDCTSSSAAPSFEAWSQSSAVVDGLLAALIFAKSVPGVLEKHVLLVSNTEVAAHQTCRLAYSLEDGAYPPGIQCSDIIKAMVASAIHLSIVCPRQLGTLQELYAMVCPQTEREREPSGLRSA